MNHWLLFRVPLVIAGFLICGCSSVSQTEPVPTTRPTATPQLAQPAATQSSATQPAPPPWVNLQPDVPFLPKPPGQPADWIVEHEPVTPDASPEARALLNYLYSISGKHTMTG